jgi:NAD-dependent SIR2 family protein deacetylase
MKNRHKTWCDKDDHKLYENYADFNEWLESEDGQPILEEYGISNLSRPSKAFYAGDKAAYDQAFKEYRKNRRHEVLNEAYFVELFDNDDHWFDHNLQRFDQLIDSLEQGNVVPFIGAGISVAGGFPTWQAHLRQQGKTSHIDPDHIENLLADGQYEKIIEEIESKRGHDVFTQEIRDVFNRTGSITDTIWRISELFTDTVITTNYDRLIEQAYDTGDKNAFQIINAMNGSEQPAADRVTIIKLHGDIKSPNKCILSKNQYDQAYGFDTLDMELPIPKLLSYYFKNSSLLFLGCSLYSDRTIQVFRTVKDQIGDGDIPQHFSIEQAPEDLKELADRNEHLARLGITAIWFEKNRFETIENLLSLAKNELRYRPMTEEITSPSIEPTDNQDTIKTELELSHFLNDFVELMPLMYWLHRPIPQGETSKYLHAMQQVFHAGSFLLKIPISIYWNVWILSCGHFQIIHILMVIVIRNFRLLSDILSIIYSQLLSKIIWMINMIGMSAR